MDDVQKLIRDIRASTDMTDAEKAKAIAKLEAEADKRSKGFKRKT